MKRAGLTAGTFGSEWKCGNSPSSAYMHEKKSVFAYEPPLSFLPKVCLYETCFETP